MDESWIKEPGAREGLQQAINHLAPLVVGQDPATIAAQLAQAVEARGLTVPPQVLQDLAIELAAGRRVAVLGS